MQYWHPKWKFGILIFFSSRSRAYFVQECIFLKISFQNQETMFNWCKSQFTLGSRLTIPNYSPLTNDREGPIDLVFCLIKSLADFAGVLAGPFLVWPCFCLDLTLGSFDSPLKALTSDILCSLSKCFTSQALRLNCFPHSEHFNSFPADKKKSILMII